MDVAKVVFIASLFSVPVMSASTNWIVRLKKDSSVSNRGYSSASANEDSREKLRKFRNDRLSKKRSLLLPRMELLVAENLSAGEVADLRANPEVAYVEKDIAWRTQTTLGDSSSWPSSFEQAPWIRDLMGFSSDAPDPELEPYAPEHSIVAIIDTGSRSDHPYLMSALETNLAEANGEPDVDDDGNGFVDDIYGVNAITRKGNGTEIYSSHGTHVAGIVKTIRDHAVAEFPQAANTTLLPIRFIGDDGSGSTATAIVALEYALSRGARVINASWGAKGKSSYSQALYESLAKLYQSDVFFAVAAGNADSQGANDNDVFPYFPANYNIPSLMSVASVTPSYNSDTGALISLNLSPFSNFGKATVQISAPGDYADGRGGMSGILSSYSGFGPWGNLYIKKQGTSMAAPVIAGIAGVMRAVNPSLTAYEIKELLVKSSKVHSSLSAIQTSSLVHARDAIALAKSTPSLGTRPRLPTTEVRQNISSKEPENRGSGCGTVLPLKRDDGPFGGNSLGLFTVAYAAWAMLNSLRKKSRLGRR